MSTRILAVATLLAAGLALSACLTKAPTFEQAADRTPEIRMLPPGAQYPAGGAAIRLWARVTNPNSFGFTLRDVHANLLLDGTRAATGNVPLGVTVNAQDATVFPIDLAINFADVPSIGDMMRRGLVGQAVPYQLSGTVDVEAGHLVTFGPMTLITGRFEASALTGLRGSPLP